MVKTNYIAIDPEALLLPSSVYIKLKAPRPPEIDIRELVERMSAEEKRKNSKYS